MSEEVIKYQRSGHAERGFFCGDRVRITTGPDAGMIGTVKDVGSQLLRVDFVKFEGHCPGSILELMPPAPAPEATEAIDWKARAEKATADQQAARAEIARLKAAGAALRKALVCFNIRRHPRASLSRDESERVVGEWDRIVGGHHRSSTRHVPLARDTHTITWSPC